MSSDLERLMWATKTLYDVPFTSAHEEVKHGVPKPLIPWESLLNTEEETIVEWDEEEIVKREKYLNLQQCE